MSVGQLRALFAPGREPLTPRALSQLQRDPRAGVRALHATLSRRFERERVERQRLDAMLHFERVLWRQGVERVAGVDEAGCGPLAGPVVAAAVVFPPGTALPGIDDSKRLDPAQREAASAAIRAAASGVGVGLAAVAEVDRLNVYQAGLLAMRRAVEALPQPPQHVLVDAREIPGIDVPQNRFEKGDGLDFSIAAASIVAKTHRDALMRELDALHPGYGFARHAGYATAEHQEAIRRLGPCPAHRQSYAFLDELQGGWSDRFYALRSRLDGALTGDELRAIEADIDARREDLAEPERRKLRLLVTRRWRSA
jgi:ribonuclease HII